MNSKDNKTSGELKREVLSELKTVRSDLDKIQGRLTPGQFIDDTLFRPDGKNPRAIFDHLAANPIGTAFLSLGTLLLMENNSHVTYETSLRQKSLAKVDSVKAKVMDVNLKVQDVVDSTKSKFEEVRNKISDKVNAKTTGSEFQFNDGGESGIASLEENITELKNTAQEKLGAVKNLDPMSYMAVGAGLGALTGMSLPVSEKEQTLIDRNFSGKLSEFSTEFQDAINQSVRMLKNELLGKFTDFDVNLFKGKTSSENTYRSE